MDNMPVLAVFLQSVPECFIFYWLVLQLFKININFSRLFCIAVIYAIYSFFIRGLPIPFGIHTILQTLLLIPLLIIMMRITLFQSIAVALFGALMAITFELLSTPVLLSITGLTLSNIISNSLLRVICPLPHMITALIIVLIFRKKNIYLLDLGRCDGSSLAGGQHH